MFKVCGIFFKFDQYECKEKTKNLIKSFRKTYIIKGFGKTNVEPL